MPERQATAGTKPANHSPKTGDVMRKSTLACLLGSAALVASPFVFADEDMGECGEVSFVQVNWTGVSAKTETAAWMLEQLGYETNVTTASVPIMFQALADEDRDAALGLWLPTQRSMVREHMRSGDIDLVTTNLDGAKYTVGVPREAYEAGVRSFADLAEHADEFGGEIYGIEAGNDGNEIVQAMIDDDAYGLGDWELVPSSEAGMLSEVRRETERGNWIAWLAWAPHPMNINFEMEFLHGGEDYWGPDQGAATVRTISRNGYGWKCENVGQFLENYTFTVEEQARMGDFIMNEGMDYDEAGRALIEEQPELLERWFAEGGTYKTGAIRTADGEERALPVMREALGL